MLASSSRREAEKTRQAKKVGCMSGIFYFLHFHRHHSRKRLPSGKRDSKTIAASPPQIDRVIKPADSGGPPPEKLPPLHSHKRPLRSEAAAPAAEPVENDNTAQSKRASAPDAAASSSRPPCGGPRSPTLSSEIRRRSSAPRRAPALVARLMGLDDAPPEEPPKESASEKRRKLLGALERCDEDLRALKKIIEALRVAESRKVTPPPATASPLTPKRKQGAGEAVAVEKRCLEVDGEQPSPVSVLDALSSPPAPANRPSNGSAPAKDGKNRHFDFSVRGNRRGSALGPKQLVVSLNRPGRQVQGGNAAANGQSPLFCRHADIAAPPRAPGTGRARTGTPLAGGEPSRAPAICVGRPWRRRPRRSRAMEESVEQVWEEGVWEERWELGRLVAALEGEMVAELAAEVAKELGFRRGRVPLPCRKSLRF